MFSEVILVDDREIANLMHQVSLCQLGMEKKVRPYTYPEKALDRLRIKNREASQPTLVILDIEMPVVNGYELLEFMAQEKLAKNIRVVRACSKIDRAGILEEIYPQYVIGSLTRPFEVRDLSRIIGSMPKVEMKAPFLFEYDR